MKNKSPTLILDSLQTHFKRVVATLAVGLVLLLGLQFAVSQPAYAQEGVTDTQQALRCGADLNFTGDNCEDGTDAGQQIEETFTTVLNLLSLAAGVAAVIMGVYAGIRYIVSAGSEKGVKAAQSSLIYAIVGLVIVAVAQAVVRFVLQQLIEP